MQELSFNTDFSFDNIESSCRFKENNINKYNFKKYAFFVSEHEGKIDYSVSDNAHSFSLLRNRFTKNKSVIIICSKDNARILDYTLSIIQKFKIDIDHDILLVDDRSENQEILNLSDKYQVSYLRIDNDLNKFNYGIINNIAASYCQFYKKELLIFYNNDVWPNNENTFNNIINKHYEYKSGLTGCKLVYPTLQMYEELGKPQHLLNNYLDKLENTIQHGGIRYDIQPHFFTKNKPVLRPNHSYRFYSKDQHLCSFDTRCFGVTGAVHIISLENFIQLGGLNTTMSLVFQDIDLCSKALINNIPIYYIGSEYMYHAESLTNASEKITETQEFIYDHILWDMLWGENMFYILGHNYNYEK